MGVPSRPGAEVEQILRRPRVGRGESEQREGRADQRKGREQLLDADEVLGHPVGVDVRSCKRRRVCVCVYTRCTLYIRRNSDSPSDDIFPVYAA